MGNKNSNHSSANYDEIKDSNGKKIKHVPVGGKPVDPFYDTDQKSIIESRYLQLSKYIEDMNGMIKILRFVDMVHTTFTKYKHVDTFTWFEARSVDPMFKLMLHRPSSKMYRTNPGRITNLSTNVNNIYQRKAILDKILLFLSEYEKKNIQHPIVEKTKKSVDVYKSILERDISDIKSITECKETLEQLFKKESIIIEGSHNNDVLGSTDAGEGSQNEHDEHPISAPEPEHEHKREPEREPEPDREPEPEPVTDFNDNNHVDYPVDHHGDVDHSYEPSAPVEGL